MKDSIKKTLEALSKAPEPWVRLGLKKHLNHDCDEALTIEALEANTARHPMIRVIIEECLQWPGYALKRHNDAKHILQKIGFLADIGLTKDIEEIRGIGEKLLAHQDGDGAFLTTVYLPRQFGGNDRADWTWMLCDFPLILHALAAFGFNRDPAVVRGMDFLASLVRENGWPCAASIPKFKGPGKREHPCPFANLIALKALSLSGGTPGMLALNEKYEDACRKGTEMLLSFWETRTAQKYFLFGMGTDFLKLKYPYVWFDILHVTEVLSRFSWVRKDKRFLDMCGRVFAKENPGGLYRPESVWMAYKGFDFARKKTGSITLTLKVLQLEQRMP